MSPKKDLVKADKEKRYRYLQEYLDCRPQFTPLVFYVDGIPGKGARSATRKVASHLSFNPKREYYEMFCFVRLRMALAVLRSNTLILRGTRDKDSRIFQNPEL